MSEEPKASPPVYAARFDPESLALSEVIQQPPSHPLRLRPVSARELIRRAMAADQRKDTSALAFYLAALTLVAGEPVNRRGVQRLGARHARNIKLNLPSTPKQLKTAIEDHRPKRLEGHAMDPSQLCTLLAPALQPLRAALGFPETNRVEASYTLDVRLLATVSHEPCRRELERVADACRGRLLQHQFVSLSSSLQEKFPDLAEDLIKEIKATVSREHLAALSLATGKGPASETFVSLANVQGDLLTLEGWKFNRLMENHDQPQRLAKLSELYQQEPGSLFAFNRHRSGELLARLDPKESTLSVVCCNEKSLQQIDGRASFLIDTDYLLCVYIALKRLREDRERFARLKEQADTSVCQDLFKHL